MWIDGSITRTLDVQYKAQRDGIVVLPITPPFTHFPSSFPHIPHFTFVFHHHILVIILVFFQLAHFFECGHEGCGDVNIVLLIVIVVVAGILVIGVVLVYLLEYMVAR